ncbi:MAG: phenylalanine--tRNA ligase subunit beta, partial [bacterium]
TMAGLEVEAVDQSSVGDVLDVKVTPNRGDCLSIVGLAREIIARLADNCEPTELWNQFQNGFGTKEAPLSPGDTPKYAKIEIDDPNLCPRYSARIIEGFKVTPSPIKIQLRIEAAGLRPINNIVDVTNYVLLELGQPLHAFDRNKITDHKIVVRQANKNEKISTIDEVEREVCPPMLMICDSEKPLAVAGVMGGFTSEVTQSTSSVLLESAHFNPLSVRRTRNLLGINTESSYRFERFVDPELVPIASYRACQLLAEWSGIEAIPGIIDLYPKPIATKTIELRMDRADKLLGMEVAPQSAREYLTRLGFEVRKAAPRRFVVTVPTFRGDISREEDLIEEVGRIHGYDKIPEKLPEGTTTQGKPSDINAFNDRLRSELTRSGLIETISHSLVTNSPLDPPEVVPIALRNPMRPDINLLRPTLLSGLAESALKNIRRGMSDLALFEIGHSFHLANGEYLEGLSVAFLLTGAAEPPHWESGRQIREFNFYDCKGITEQVFCALGLNDQEYLPLNDLRFHPGQSAMVIEHDCEVGRIGQMHPDIQAQYDFQRPVFLGAFDIDQLMRVSSASIKYQPIPRFPGVRRDIAFVIDKSIPWMKIEATIHQAAGTLVETVRLFDIYTGPPVPEGKHSLAVTLTIRKSDGTFTEDEIVAYIDSIQVRLRDELGSTRRT